jgi:hypothetical protein
MGYRPGRGEPRGEVLTAWSVSEGDRLPGGETVVLVDREPVSGRVEIVCDSGERRRHDRDDRLTITARSPRGRSLRVPGFIDAPVYTTAVELGLFSATVRGAW